MNTGTDYAPGIPVSDVSSSCRIKCTEKFSFDDKQSFIKFVYDGCIKNEQYIFLMGLITHKDPVRNQITRIIGKEPIFLC